MHAGQMRWLQSALSEPPVVNQLELSVAQLDAIDVGTTFNDPQAATRPGGGWAGTLEYAQQHGVQLQAWGSLAQGRFNDPSPSPAAKVVHEIAETAPYAPQRRAAGLAAAASGGHPTHHRQRQRGAHPRLWRRDADSAEPGGVVPAVCGGAGTGAAVIHLELNHGHRLSAFSRFREAH
jgi:hypothetical protein